MGILFGLALPLLCCGGERHPKPDLLLISVEGLPPDELACYGGSPDTGYAICEVGAEGGRFVWAFSPSPATGPAAAALLTGHDPRQSGVTASAASFLPSSQRTLAERLREEAGYTTAAFVGNPELNRSRNLHQGFDVYGDRHDIDTLVAAARSWARQAQGPWFLWVHFPDPLAGTKPSAREPNPTEPRLSGTGLHRLDRRIGELVHSLDQGARRPGILLVGLHGRGRAESGSATDTESPLSLRRLRIPMLWRTPPETSGPGIGRRITRAVGLVDATPTLLEVAGLPPTPDLLGQPLPYANSEQRPARILTAEHPDAVAIIHGTEYAQFPLPETPTAVARHGRLWPVGQSDSERTPEPDARGTGAERSARLYELAKQA
ncbi:MAG: sulfatase-like hydrolase/transferase, partial [Myxococcota bacterium]